jgi:hypothetical protein
MIEICLDFGLPQMTNRFNATFLSDVDDLHFGCQRTGGAHTGLLPDPLPADARVEAKFGSDGRRQVWVPATEIAGVPGRSGPVGSCRPRVALGIGAKSQPKATAGRSAIGRSLDGQ